MLKVLVIERVLIMLEEKKEEEEVDIPPEEKKELLDVIKDSDVKIIIAEKLCDGLWHSTAELWRAGKQVDHTLGLIKTGMILKLFQEILGEHIVNEDNNDLSDVISWRINPKFVKSFEEIVKKASIKKQRETKSFSAFNVF